MIALYKHERDIADWFSTLVCEKLIIVWEVNLKLPTSKKWKKKTQTHPRLFLWILPGQNNFSVLKDEMCMYSVNRMGKSS